MKHVYILYENNEIITIFDNFLKFRKNSFHYILNVLVRDNHFKNKLEGGKKLKKNFSDFYSENLQFFKFQNYSWKIAKFKLNNLAIEKKEPVSEKENQETDENKIEYETNFTKLSIIKGSSLFKSLNQNLSYIKLSPLYGL